jgi:2-phospho-L-lactate guanylyltransferase (CobY/MobA/RfbA family)
LYGDVDVDDEEDLVEMMMMMMMMMNVYLVLEYGYY